MEQHNWKRRVKGEIEEAQAVIKDLREVIKKNRNHKIILSMRVLEWTEKSLEGMLLHRKALKSRLKEGEK